MAVNAEQLNIILSAKTADLTKQLKSAENKVARFTKQSNRNLSKTSKAFGGLAKSAAAFLPALGAAAIISKVKSVVSEMDEIGKTADRIGITTDALQLLRATAESAGVAQSALDSSIEKLSKGLAEATMGLGTAKDALKVLGLNAKDLIALGLDGAMAKIADEVNQLPSAMEKTAIATQLFGRSGAPMLNLLREGSAGMAQMQKDARALGVVIDEDLIRSAEDAQTQLDLMSRVINANLSSALINLAPLLINTAAGLASVSASAGDIFSQIQDIRENGLAATAKTNDYINQVLDAARANGELGEQIAAVEASQMALDNFIPSGTGEIELPDRTQLLADLAALEAALGDPMGADAANEAAAAFQRILDQSTLGLVAAQNQNEVIKEQNRLRNIGAEAAERERIATEKTLLMSKITSPFSGDSFSVEAVNARLEAERLGDEYEKAAIAASLILNPVEAVAAAGAGAAASLETVVDLMAEASPLLSRLGVDAEAFQGIMSSVEGSMESAFMSMVDGTSTASDAFKSMATDIIKELYRVLVVKQITGFISGAIGGYFNANQVSGPSMPLGTGNIRPPNRAGGGSAIAGQAYTVGEHGREPFVPAQNGRILSTAQAKSAIGGGGGGGVTVIQNNTFGNGVNRAEINAMLPKIVEASKAAVLDAKRRGGSFAGAF